MQRILCQTLNDALSCNAASQADFLHDWSERAVRDRSSRAGVRGFVLGFGGVFACSENGIARRVTLADSVKDPIMPSPSG